jgi:hypothetical protein
MPEPSSAASELDARLAEIDGRLRGIQADLVPEPERPEVPAAAAPAGGEHVDPIRQLAALTALQERLLRSIRELLSAYETVCARLQQVGPEPTVHEFTVSAGPFTSTDALREFEQTLSAMSGVREVSVRGYEGEDRAIVDVRLGGAKS